MRFQLTAAAAMAVMSLCAAHNAFSQNTPNATDASGTMSDISGEQPAAAARAALCGDYRKVAEIAAQNPDTRQSLPWSLNYLKAQSDTDRETRLATLELLSGAAPNREQRTRAQLALLDDECYEAAVLGRRVKFNKFSRVFNRASGALSKLALFQPQDAALLALDTVYTRKKWAEVETPERRMAWLLRRFMEQYPDSPEVPEAKQQLEQLKPKLDKDYVARKLAAGETCLAQGNFDGTRMNFEHAAIVMPDAPEVTEAMARFKEARQRDEIRCAKAVAVDNGEDRMDAADRTLIHKATRALINGNDKVFAETLNTPCAAADSLAYAASGVMERRGKHEQALLQLSNITAVWPDSPGGTQARAQLMNPDYSLDFAFDLALEDLDQRRQKFIRTGNRTDEDNNYQLAATGINATAGPFAAISAPILFAGDMTIRGVSEMFRTALDVDMAIDAGARYNSRYPKTERAKEIAAALSELCRKAGDLKRAKQFADLAGGPSAKQQTQFAKMSAAQLLRSASTTADPGDRKALLTKIVEQYPGTRQAKRAQKDLDLVAPCTARGSLCIPTRLLARDPQFVQMLGIPANMADGSWLNGEINKIGLTFAPNVSLFEYRDGNGWQSVQIPASARSSIMSRAQELLAADDMKREGEKRLTTRLIPLEISGGVGAGGVDFAPRIMPQDDDVDRLKLFQE